MFEDKPSGALLDTAGAPTFTHARARLIPEQPLHHGLPTRPAPGARKVLAMPIQWLTLQEALSAITAIRADKPADWLWQQALGGLVLVWGREYLGSGLGQFQEIPPFMFSKDVEITRSDGEIRCSVLSSNATPERHAGYGVPWDAGMPGARAINYGAIDANGRLKLPRVTSTTYANVMVDANSLHQAIQEAATTGPSAVAASTEKPAERQRQQTSKAKVKLLSQRPPSLVIRMAAELKLLWPTGEPHGLKGKDRDNTAIQHLQRRGFSRFGKRTLGYAMAKFRAT